MFKHILLPTDGSPLSDAAIEKGIAFARSIHAKVTGLCVVPKVYPSYYDGEIPSGITAQAEERMRADAKIHMAALARVAHGAGVACDTVVEISDYPYEAILTVAEEQGCDLILMASHGRKGIRALLLGSETQKVLTHSKIPVLVFR
jgi:nucleotide-binding universal stress UspA family protein